MALRDSDFCRFFCILTRTEAYTGLTESNVVFLTVRTKFQKLVNISTAQLKPL